MGQLSDGTWDCATAAYDAIFKELKAFEKLLSKNKYLLGAHMTEADWRFFKMLERFDAVHRVHFECNLRIVRDYPHLHRYLQELFQHPRAQQTG